MEKKKYTWQEMHDLMFKFNEEHGHTSKGNAARLVAVAVIKEESFKRKYSLLQRSYQFTSDNKAFIPGQIGRSVFANCLDGTDMGVRLDYYIPNSWQVDYCYLVEEDEQ